MYASYEGLCEPVGRVTSLLWNVTSIRVFGLMPRGINIRYEVIRITADAAR